MNRKQAVALAVFIGLFIGFGIGWLSFGMKKNGSMVSNEGKPCTTPDGKTGVTQADGSCKA